MPYNLKLTGEEQRMSETDDAVTSPVERLVMWFFNKTHKHKWKTTHTNPWIHPTRQVCKCGLSRTFEYKDNADEIKGMPWSKGHWVCSDGTTSEYSVGD